MNNRLPTRKFMHRRKSKSYGGLIGNRKQQAQAKRRQARQQRRAQKQASQTTTTKLITG